MELENSTKQRELLAAVRSVTQSVLVWMKSMLLGDRLVSGWLNISCIFVV